MLVLGVPGEQQKKEDSGYPITINKESQTSRRLMCDISRQEPLYTNEIGNLGLL